MGRKPKEAESAKLNLSAKNAEKAYQILTQVFNKENKSMFDMMFDMDLQDGISIYGKLTDEEKESFKTDLMEAEKAGKMNDRIFNLEMLKKYPKAFEKNTDFGIEIRKVFLLNEQNMGFAKELSKLFTGNEAEDIKEAVGYAFAYIVFLRQV